MYPGWVGTGVAGRAIPVPTPVPSQGPIYYHIQASGPTHGQMKVNNLVSMRFPRKGLELTSEWTRIDPRIDPLDDPPDWSPDCPQIPISQTSDIHRSRIGLI